MGLFSKLFGGGGIPEVPFEPMDLREVHTRACRTEPIVATVDPDLAFGELTGRLAAEPSNPTLLGGVAAAQLCLGDYEGGVDAMNLAIFHDHGKSAIKEHTRFKATTLDLFLDRPQEAMEEYEVCRNIDPDWPELKLFLAEMAFRQRQKAKVTKYLRQVLPLGLDGPLSDAEAALHAEDHGAVVDALQVYHRISLLLAIKKAQATVVDTSGVSLVPNQTRDFRP